MNNSYSINTTESVNKSINHWENELRELKSIKNTQKNKLRIKLLNRLLSEAIWKIRIDWIQGYTSDIVWSLLIWNEKKEEDRWWDEISDKWWKSTRSRSHDKRYIEWKRKEMRQEAKWNEWLTNENVREKLFFEDYDNNIFWELDEEYMEAA